MSPRAICLHCSSNGINVEMQCVGERLGHWLFRCSVCSDTASLPKQLVNTKNKKADTLRRFMEWQIQRATGISYANPGSSFTKRRLKMTTNEKIGQCVHKRWFHLKDDDEGNPVYIVMYTESEGGEWRLAVVKGDEAANLQVLDSTEVESELSGVSFYLSRQLFHSNSLTAANLAGWIQRKKDDGLGVVTSQNPTSDAIDIHFSDVKLANQFIREFPWILKG